MSTPLLSSDRFQNVSNALFCHATESMSRSSCSSLCGEICRALGVDPFGPTAPADLRAAIEAAAFDWARANYNAHVVRYEDAPAYPGAQSERRPAAPGPVRIRIDRRNCLNVPALLKALRAIRYNCDGGGASGATVNASLAKLDTLIDSLKDIVCEMVPEYQAAEWAI